MNNTEIGSVVKQNSRHVILAIGLAFAIIKKRNKSHNQSKNLMLTQDDSHANIPHPSNINSNTNEQQQKRLKEQIHEILPSLIRNLPLQLTTSPCVMFDIETLNNEINMNKTSSIVSISSLLCQPPPSANIQLHNTLQTPIISTFTTPSNNFAAPNCAYNTNDSNHLLNALISRNLNDADVQILSTHIQLRIVQKLLVHVVKNNQPVTAYDRNPATSSDANTISVSTQIKFYSLVMTLSKLLGISSVSATTNTSNNNSDNSSDSSDTGLQCVSSQLLGLTTPTAESQTVLTGTDTTSSTSTYHSRYSTISNHLAMAKDHQNIHTNTLFISIAVLKAIHRAVLHVCATITTTNNSNNNKKVSAGKYNETQGGSYSSPLLMQSVQQQQPENMSIRHSSLKLSLKYNNIMIYERLSDICILLIQGVRHIKTSLINSRKSSNTMSCSASTSASGAVTVSIEWFQQWLTSLVTEGIRLTADLPLVHAAYGTLLEEI